MALHWSVSDVRDWKEIMDEDSGEYVFTEAMIWRTMTIGINQITEKNWQEVYKRCKLCDDLFGMMVFKRDPETKQKISQLTPEAIHRRIGLSTNASNMREAQFLNNMKKRVWDDVCRHASREITKFERATARSEPESEPVADEAG